MVSGAADADIADSHGGGPDRQWGRVFGNCRQMRKLNETNARIADERAGQSGIGAAAEPIEAAIGGKSYDGSHPGFRLIQRSHSSSRAQGLHRRGIEHSRSCLPIMRSPVLFGRHTCGERTQRVGLVQRAANSRSNPGWQSYD
jgi:hypothetical protein